MKVRVDELSGVALDWAVAKCEGKNGILHDDGITRCIVIAAPSGVYKGTYRPTINWSQGGPIIEREEIGLQRNAPCLRGREWEARPSPLAKGAGGKWGYGPTPLVAGMRAYVAGKLGEEVEVPNTIETFGEQT